MTETHRHCQCDNCSGEDCGQDNPEEYKKAEKEREKAIRQDERDKIYKRLQSMVTDVEPMIGVMWSDIDCLFAELKEDPEKEAAPVGDAEWCRTQ